MALFTQRRLRNYPTALTSKPFLFLLLEDAVSPLPVSLPYQCLSLTSVSPLPVSLPYQCLSLTSVSPLPVSLPYQRLSLTSVSPLPASLPYQRLSLTSVSPLPASLPYQRLSLTSVSPLPVSLPYQCLSLTSVSPLPVSLQPASYDFFSNTPEHPAQLEHLPPECLICQDFNTHHFIGTHLRLQPTGSLQLAPRWKQNGPYYGALHICCHRHGDRMSSLYLRCHLLSPAWRQGRYTLSHTGHLLSPAWRHGRYTLSTLSSAVTGMATG